MSFVIYPHLILLISDQIFEVTVAHENFWELNGLTEKHYDGSLYIAFVANINGHIKFQQGESCERRRNLIRAADRDDHRGRPRRG